MVGAKGTLECVRPFSHLPSFGSHWVVPHVSRCPPTASSLGWRLAADLELVPTRVIRLFKLNRTSQGPAEGTDKGADVISAKCSECKCKKNKGSSGLHDPDLSSGS